MANQYEGKNESGEGRRGVRMAIRGLRKGRREWGGENEE